MRRWGISGVEARRAFDMAYQYADFEMGRTEAYGFWLQSIGDVDRNGYLFGTLDYSGDGFFIQAVDVSGVWHVNMKGVFNSPDAKESGKTFGTQSDNYRGLFARAIVALGGRAGIHRIKGVYLAGGEEASMLARSQGQDRLNIAAHFDLGKLTDEFLNFSPLHVHEAILNARYEVYYGLARQTLYPHIPDDDSFDDRAGPELQTGVRGLDDRLLSDNLDTGANGLDDGSGNENDEKEELLGDTKESSPQNHTDKNPLLD
jgi:hypothetical protein